MSTAAAVQRRIEDVADSVEQLEKSLGNLQLTDKMLLGAISTQRLLSGVKKGPGHLKDELYKLCTETKGALLRRLLSRVRKGPGHLKNELYELRRETRGALLRRLLGDVRNGPGHLRDQLYELRQETKGALLRLSREPTRGRMPGFAGQELANQLCQILYEESGKRPTTKKDETFDRLLRLAFHQSAIAPSRKDVVDLMRSALRGLVSKRVLGVESVLSHF